MIACAYEDRPAATVGLKLLVLSLEAHCPDLELHLYHRLDDPRFLTWVGAFPQVKLHEPPPNSRSGWDVKPALILDLFAAGQKDVCWLDSDLIVTRDFRALLGPLKDDTVVAAEERRHVPGHGSDARTVRLGLRVGRVFQKALCTCVLRVTTRHRALVERWAQALERADYRTSQAQPFPERDWVVGGDQDMLAGLLGAEEFADFPVRQLRSGRDVAHCFLRSGYPVKDRLRNLWRGLPPLVHAQGPKPWELEGALFAELSPYCAAARPYQARLDEPTPWLSPRSLAAKALDGLALGNPNLRDLPIAGWDELRTCVRGLGQRNPQ